MATLDRDAGEPRLPDLVTARDELRARGELLPIALGEAVPHGEAWLVDDLEPLRTVLGHPATARAPARRHPKDELTVLIAAADRPERPVEVLGLLAAKVDLARCRHAGETGLRAFHDDVLRELQ